MATHLWVGMVVAPWHHLVAHRLPVVAAATQDDAKSATQHCHCRHHHPVCDSNATLPSVPVPSTPDHDHDDCLVCQVLAQAVAASEMATLEPTTERIEFSPPVSAIQPMLGASIEPVSRGPPAV